MGFRNEAVMFGLFSSPFTSFILTLPTKLDERLFTVIDRPTWTWNLTDWLRLHLVYFLLLLSSAYYGFPDTVPVIQ